MEIRLRAAVLVIDDGRVLLVPRWFAEKELSEVEYHPKQVVDQAVGKG